MPTTPVAVSSNVFLQADSAASANSLAQRDGSGGLAIAAMAVSSLANTGTEAVPITTLTGAATIGVHNVILADATSAAFTLTLPAAATATGRKYTVKKIDSAAHSVTLAGNGAETIDGSNTVAISSQWGVLRVISNGTSWFVI